MAVKTQNIRNVIFAIRRFIRVVRSGVHRRGGIVATFAKAFNALNREGFTGIRARLTVLFGEVADFVESKPHPQLPNRESSNLFSEYARREYYRASTDDTAISIPLDAKIIEKKARLKIAVHIHIYYLELSEEFKYYLDMMPKGIDIYITTQDSINAENYIKINFSNYDLDKLHISRIENIGRDINSKFFSYPEIYEKYDLVLFLHSKRSVKNENLELWRTYLLETLCGSEAITRSIIDLFDKYPCLGMVGAQNFEPIKHWLSWERNYEHGFDLASKMGIDLKSITTLDFPSGSFFWARPSALSPLRKAVGGPVAFKKDDETKSYGTLAHAVERLFYVSCEQAGFTWLKVARPDLLLDQSSVIDFKYEEQLKSYIKRNRRIILSNRYAARRYAPNPEWQTTPALQQLAQKHKKLSQPANSLASKRTIFSVILPTHNRLDGLRTAVQSVLRQSIPDFELIIVDDASSDGTVSWIRNEYSDEIRVGRIKLVELPVNSGVCYARNRGLEIASGDWICYLDSDNRMLPNFLEVFLKGISQNPESDCFHAQLLTHPDGVVVGKAFDRAKILKSNYIDIGVFVHSRNKLSEKGYFDESLRRLVDWDLIIRYTSDREPVFIEEVILDYDNNPQNSDRITIKESAALARFSIMRKLSQEPTVTTAIISYNQEKYIKKAIESAISQKGILNQIFLSDDGSKDKTREIMAAYKRSHALILHDISRDRNVGISENFKRCFEEADAEFIAILEGDDYWTDTRKLVKQATFLKRNTKASMVFGAVNILDERTGTIKTLDRQKKIKKSLLSGADFISDPSLNLIANFSSCMFRSALVKELPDILFRDRISEIALAFHLEKFGPIGYLPEPMSVYRQHQSGVWTGSSRKEQIMSGRRTREAALEVADSKYQDSISRIIEERYTLD